MGNICCEDSAPPRPKREIVPRSLTQQHNKDTPLSPEEQRKQMQKKIFQEFAVAVKYLKNSMQQKEQTFYTGAYNHTIFFSDEVADYYTSTLVEGQNELKPCIVKRIVKERIQQEWQQQALAIQYLVTNFHTSRFIVNTLYFYQDNTHLNLYFNLHNYFHLNCFTSNSNPEFSNYFYANTENNIRFIIAGIILGLEQLHKMEIVYRGINTQNIVIRQNGYPILTNLINLHSSGKTTRHTYSNPYISPQQYRNQPITKSSDFWSLGVLIYHLITKTFPNYSNFTENQFHPLGFSDQLADLVNKLLIFNSDFRLGSRNINDLKAHAFFYGFQWNEYSKMQIQSPFSRQVEGCPQRRSSDSKHEYNNQYNFDYSTSYGMMGTMLFLDIAGLYLLYSWFDEPSFNDMNIAENEQQQILANDNQQGCEIELSDKSDGNGGGFDGGQYGGDYD